MTSLNDLQWAIGAALLIIMLIIGGWLNRANEAAGQEQSDQEDVLTRDPLVAAVPSSSPSAMASADAMQAECKETKEEAELTLLQLHQVQEELESVFLSDQAKAAELEQLQQQLCDATALREQLEARTNAEKEAKQEAELTLLQLHQVQEELEHYFLLSQELQSSSAISPEQQQRLRSCNERLELLLLHQKQRDQRLAALIDRQQRNLQRAALLLQGVVSPSKQRRQSDVALI